MPFDDLMDNIFNAILVAIGLATIAFIIYLLRHRGDDDVPGSIF